MFSSFSFQTQKEYTSLWNLAKFQNLAKNTISVYFSRIYVFLEEETKRNQLSCSKKSDFLEQKKNKEKNSNSLSTTFYWQEVNSIYLCKRDANLEEILFNVVFLLLNWTTEITLVLSKSILIKWQSTWVSCECLRKNNIQTVLLHSSTEIIVKIEAKCNCHFEVNENEINE